MTESDNWQPKRLISSEQGIRLTPPQLLKGASRLLGDILGHGEYNRFWKEIMDNNPGKE